jgi:putative SOS response-associated peptidase YedK
VEPRSTRRGIRACRGAKSNLLDGEHLLFGFLTTEPNDTVAPVHPKAMPVILTSAEEIDIWMSAPAQEALTLQRPLPDGMLQIVARGERKDEPLALV